MIQVKHYSFAYEGDLERKILDDINFQIEEGTITAVLGLSGCGKTTLCLSLCGIIPNCLVGEQRGEIWIKGENIKGIQVNVLASTIGYVMQNPDEQLVCTTVEDELAFAPENLLQNPSDIRKRVDWVIEVLNMEDLRFLNPNQLSGGQKQLVAIGSILTLDPKILILDEPISSLDAYGKGRIRELLLLLKHLGKTIVVVEHDLESLEFADNWLILSQGKMIAHATPTQLMNNKKILKEENLL